MTESPKEPLAPAILPASIGPYKIESLLDKGGTSLLYLGIHPDTLEPLTIKVLSTHHLSHPEMIDRFIQESKIIGLSSHPNIVKLYGEGKWEGGLYIAMEFVQGISLRQLILQNSLSLKRSLDIVLQISYALTHLHANGIIHRDLKPENILLTSTGGIKVIDFGISLLMQEQTDPAKVEGLVGTPVYMSPEQKKNPLDVSYNSDIYSLGLITYELVLGKLSHGDVHISLMPRGLQKILAKALQPDPLKRYQDIVDFITDLNAYLSSVEFEKDLRGKDFVSDISDEVHEAPRLFLPQNPPNWPHVEIGIANDEMRSLSAMYYDFFTLKEGRLGILLAEPSDKGVKGLVAIASLRGMIHAINSTCQHPKDLVEKLNALIVSDKFDQFFTVCSLVLDPVKHQFYYLSCGYGPLWSLPSGSEHPKIITADNVALGLSADTEFMEITANWMIGDTLVLPSFAAHVKDNSSLENLIKDAQFLPAQKMAEALLRKNSLKDTDLTERTQTFVTITRSS